MRPEPTDVFGQVSVDRPTKQDEVAEVLTWSLSPTLEKDIFWESTFPTCSGSRPQGEPGSALLAYLSGVQGST